jgi:hypothetical protein
MPLRPRALPLDRPGWVTAGLARLAVLALFVVLVGMVRVHLTRTSAAVGACAAALAAAGALAVFLGAAGRVAGALPFLEGPQRRTTAILAELRRVGLPLVGLAFFLLWTFVYVALWAVHPHEAFAGLSPRPLFADFFYYAVTTAFISPPGDVLAHSRGARSATMIEMLTAFALLTTYVSSFVDWHGSALQDRREVLVAPPGQAHGDELGV